MMVGYDAPVAASVEQGYLAAAAGIRAGDKIVKIGDKKIHIFREVTSYNQFHQGEAAKVTYERNGKTYTVKLTPKMDKKRDIIVMESLGPVIQKLLLQRVSSMVFMK